VGARPRRRLNFRNPPAFFTFLVERAAAEVTTILLAWMGHRAALTERVPPVSG